MVDAPINPEVANTIADMDGERIAARSGLDFPRHFWSALKNGHYRSALGGVAIGATVGAAIGAAVCGLLAAAGAVASFGAVATLVIPAFIATGALMLAEGFGAIGAASSSRASGLAEKHARILDLEAQGKSALIATDDKLMYNGNGHHYEFPPERDKGKLFYWKSGVVGGLLGAASGAVMGLGLGAVAAEIPAVAAVAGTIGQAVAAVGLASTAIAAAPALAIAGALAFGAFGLTFGIERRLIKTSMNHTDANIGGQPKFATGPDLGKQQSRESDYDLAQHRLRRQAEIVRLEKAYNERIRWGATDGRFKGVFGGVVPGVIGGAAMGLLVAGAVALMPGALALGAAVHLIVPVFAAGGGALAMKTFAESGTEAGAEATARAIDNEFERNRSLRARGIMPAPPKEPKGSWLSPKAMVFCAGVGAAAATALGIGPAALALAGVHAAGTLTSVATSCAIGSLAGSTWGLGGKTFKALVKPADWAYDTFAYRHDDPGPEKPPLYLPPPAIGSKITPEEAALLNERLSAGSGKNFTQMTQQVQPAPFTVGA